jgi:hypothetical protein
MNKNDIVYTPERISKGIIKHFSPIGICLDPCRGSGAFHKYMPEGSLYCEIQEGIDFYTFDKKVDWIISNPPFSEYDTFLKKAFEVSLNVVFLIPLYKTFKSKKQQNLVNDYGGLKEILIIGSGSEIGFNMGFLCGCVYYKKDYKGLVKVSQLKAQQDVAPKV